MHWRTLCVAVLAALIAGSLAVPAGAQTEPARKPGAAPRNGKAPPRVIVEKRSFLDAGTEVKPGQRKFTDYAFPPGYSPTSSIDFTTGNVRGPLVGPWDTSRGNFWPW
jgi:lipoprotein-anchoring transpeptidase ErfK/SrfK